jgi:hypothetical protein
MHFSPPLPLLAAGASRKSVRFFWIIKKGDDRMTFATETAPRSHRPQEDQEHYRVRLNKAKLKKTELAEIESIYTRLDEERASQGKLPAERAPWSAADILEWQDLNNIERFLDLETYARAADHVSNPPPPMPKAEPPKPAPRLLNKMKLTRTEQPRDAIYIGRGSKWGNPFRIGPDGNRDDVIAQHEYWLAHQNDLLRKIDDLKGRDLICYCSPLGCHGTLLMKLANATRDGGVT